MYFSTSTIALVAALAATTSAHMNMADPPPLMYKGNPNAKTIDYSITSPNTADTFPCKGALSVFDSDEGTPVATWAPGSQQTITLEGGATHNGGSCQVSLSYDSGKTWTAIYSKEGGCPTTPSLNFTVPSDAPAADKVLLGWSWINHSGNREYYMNCASITISGSSSKREERVRKPARRDVAFNNRPAMFVAQFPTISEYCVAEGLDVAFPEPGPDLDVDSGATTGAPTICSGASVTATIGAGGAGSSASTASAAATTTAAAAGTTTTAAAATTTAAATSKAAATSSASLYVSSSSLHSSQGTSVTKGPFINTTSAATTTLAALPTVLTIIPISKSGSSSVLIGSSSSTGGVFLTIPIGGSSSSASSAAAQTTTLATKTTAAAGSASNSAASTKSSSAAASTGSAAAGAQSGACTDEGAWSCDSTGSSFQRCASGQWSNAVPMAAGTSCTPGISDTLSMQRRKERFMRRSFGDYHL